MIGQANGMLVQRWKLSEDAAFGVLSRMSMDSNAPLREVTARMVESGVFPRTRDDET